MTNPFITARDEAQRAARESQLQVAKVISVPSHDAGDENKHLVKCAPLGTDTTVTAAMSVTQKGDVSPPTADANTFVLLGHLTSERPVILDTLYVNENDVPQYDAGERKIGHPLSDANIFFDDDGNVRVENDAGTQVVIEGRNVYIDAPKGKVVLGDKDGTSKPVARKGDPVSVDTTSGDGSITDGSTDVEST